MARKTVTQADLRAAGAASRARSGAANRARAAEVERRTMTRIRAEEALARAVRWREDCANELRLHKPREELETRLENARAYVRDCEAVIAALENPEA